MKFIALNAIKIGNCLYGASSVRTRTQRGAAYAVGAHAVSKLGMMEAFIHQTICLDEGEGK